MAKTKIIYACSGASDVGKIADEAARALSKEGYARMSCLAAIGADSGEYVDAARAADMVIVVDGCPIACARKNLERIGVAPVAFVLTKMGLVKGMTPPTEKVIAETAKKIKETAGENPPPSCGSGCGSCGGCKI